MSERRIIQKPIQKKVFPQLKVKPHELKNVNDIITCFSFLLLSNFYNFGISRFLGVFFSRLSAQRLRSPMSGLTLATSCAASLPPTELPGTPVLLPMLNVIAPEFVFYQTSGTAAVSQHQSKKKVKLCKKVCASSAISLLESQGDGLIVTVKPKDENI